MLKSNIEIKVSGKNIRYFIKLMYKNNINFLSLDIHDNYFYAVIDRVSYRKLLTIKTSYDIEIKRLYGFLFLKEIINNNKVFILSFIFSIFLFNIFTHIVFNIEIVSDDKKMVAIINKILLSKGIKKYTFMKSFDDICLIKEDILSQYKDLFEWIEIEKSGVKYYVRFEKRIKNDLKEIVSYRHVVSKKNAIVKKIYASSGEVNKKVNDYVSSGDILISGEIHKGEKIVDNVSADGKVYGEVWYKAKVSLPINYYKKTITKKIW